MAQQLPTTKEIANQIIFDIEAKLGQSIPFLPKAVFRVLSFALAGVFTILYKYGGWQFLQIFVSTAGIDSLRKWGALFDIFQKLASSSNLQVKFTGDASLTIPIFTGTQLLNTDTQIVYITDTDVTMTGGIALVNITALTGGSIGNIADGNFINFVTPLNGVNNFVEVITTNQLGIDDEPIDDFRTRVVNRFRKPPQGGAYADYEAWSLEVLTINHAYPYSGDKEGTVQIYVESSVSPNGIPTAIEMNAVINSINLRARRPLTAQVFVFPIRLSGFTVQVNNLYPDTQGTRDAIFSSLMNYFLDREPFIDGLQSIDKSNINNSQITAIVVTATQINNARFDSINFYLTINPSLFLLNYQLGQGEKSKLDNVNYA